MIVLLGTGFWKQEGVKHARTMKEHNRLVENVDLIIALVEEAQISWKKTEHAGIAYHTKHMINK